MFLEVVSFSADVCGDFFAVGESDTGDFAECGVRFFGCYRFDLEADAAFLRACIDGFDLRFFNRGPAWVTN